MILNQTYADPQLAFQLQLVISFAQLGQRTTSWCLSASPAWRYNPSEESPGNAFSAGRWTADDAASDDAASHR